MPSSDQDQLPPRLSRWMQQAGPGREPEACRLTQGSAQTPGSQPPSDAGHGQEAAAWGEQKPLWGQSSVLCCPPWALLFPGATSPPPPPPLTGVLPPQASSSCGLRGVPRPLVALGPCNPSSVRQVDPQSVSLWAEVLGQGRERPGRSGLCTLGHGARGAPSRPLLVVPLALFFVPFLLVCRPSFTRRPSGRQHHCCCPHLLHSYQRCLLKKENLSRVPPLLPVEWLPAAHIASRVPVTGGCSVVSWAQLVMARRPGRERLPHPPLR